MRPPSIELRKFLEAYDPKIARLYLAARRTVLAAAPQANELIYDAYNAVTTAYAFSEHLKHAFCHVAAFRDHVNLGFNDGANLPDPEQQLVGSGRKIRHIGIASLADLRRPGVRDLLRAAVVQGQELCAAARNKPRAIIKAVYVRRRRPPSRQQSSGTNRSTRRVTRRDRSAPSQ
jgi:hypothetical protein